MNIRNAILSIIVFFTILFSGCNNPRSQSNDDQGLNGTISISGAFALYPMTVRWAEEFQKVYPNVRIDVSAGGAGKGMADALSGMVDLGMFSREVSIEEENKGAWKIALTKDAVLPTVNSDNPVIKNIKDKGFTKSNFIDLFINKKYDNWKDLISNPEYKEKIVIYTRSDACGAADMWGRYLGGNQESLQGIGVYGDPGMADAVKKDINGIGYNNVIYIYDITSRMKYGSLDVIPIDINENGQIDPEENFYNTLDEIMQAIQEGKYPSPPARELYFVSKGKPTNTAAKVFIKWILTEGQKFVKEAGYVQLSEDKIRTELKKLED